MLSFEDFTPGWSCLSERITVSLDDMLAFATRFDAQDFHTDPEAARASFLGELIGSGWHSAALMMRLMARSFLLQSRSAGSPGIEELRWLRPTRPGDALQCRTLVLESRASQSRPDFGLVKFRFTLVNQHDEPVLEQINWIMVGKRHTPVMTFDLRKNWPAHYTPPVPAGPMLPPASAPAGAGEHGRYAIGEERDLGAFTFSEGEILAFARPFDPQYFHLDDAAARHSPLGGLCASGWHTAAVWMMLMVADRRRREAEAAPLPAQKLGPSPGFRNLRWLKPVLAGQTIRYFSRVADIRASASRPGWGLMFHHNRGVDEAGTTVFSFDGCVFCALPS